MQASRVKALKSAVASAALLLVVLASVTQVFMPGPAPTVVASVALVLYFLVTWRNFSGAAWLTTGLCVTLLLVVVIRGLPIPALLEGMARMNFLAALLAVMGFLRVAAGSDPQIVQAGAVLTNQPPGRRYVAMSFGGQILGMLVNFGGLAILLEMTKRAVDAQRDTLPEATLDGKLRRMTTATLRGFSLLPLWSPIGIGINAMLLAMPGLRYTDLIGGGLAGCALLTGWGWFLDWKSVPRSTTPPTPRMSVDMRPLLALLAHIVALVGTIAVTKAVTGAPFQSALLVAIPLYSVVWSVWSLRHQLRPGKAARQVIVTGVQRFPLAAAEIAVFASAGLLSVLVLQVVPTEATQHALTALGRPWLVIVVLNTTLFALATIGVNPIITASVMATLIGQFDIPGLGDVPVALALAGGWSTVMGFTPAVTTVTFAAAIVGRPAATVGLRWNGAYCVSAFILWTGLVAGWVAVTG